MSEIQLLQHGINLMIVGMGFVLFFLLILIYAISFMSKLINRFFPETVIPNENLKPITPADDELARLRPVIIAAVHHHRRQQGQKSLQGE
ncbi:oxaloacetate decarboxylase subunit gamma [Volucribacter amazonae]|uniref:Probable oxaloacetate decarboxylase gamma chain n=1 Tax=Volucribacter amazonae TaxID=256731 RepID=A0A9X4PCW6_9PAST|nr:oxaloacetate decarboxylase subunit gamma [Volucribacter amazonae]MDG6895261.1 oxaloacetate decarboxylase gamma chain [Volucribacter amazonae]